MTGSADDATLRRALEQAIGEEKVRTDDSILRTYSTDASPCAVEPRAVAFAETEDDVRAVLQVCRELEVPITPRASGTSLSGAAIGPGVVLDTTRFHRILEFDLERRRIRVEPGILLAELNAYLAERGMRFAPDPGSQDLCRIGGMVGHNASGYRSVKYGQTRDHVLGLRILLADGTPVHAHDIPLEGAEWREIVGRANGLEQVRKEIEAHQDAILSSRRPIRKHSCGYDLVGPAESLARGVFPLASLFVGSEGTLGVVTEVTLRVLPVPARRVTMLLYLDRFEDLGPAVADILTWGPSAIEAVDGDSLALLDREVGTPKSRPIRCANRLSGKSGDPCSRPSSSGPGRAKRGASWRTRSSRATGCRSSSPSSWTSRGVMGPPRGSTVTSGTGTRTIARFSIRPTHRISSACERCERSSITRSSTVFVARHPGNMESDGSVRRRCRASGEARYTASCDGSRKRSIPTDS